MTKKFENIAEDGVEKAFRRGFSVPNGAVNLAWVKSPSLNPHNNVVIIDTSKVVSENAIERFNGSALAYANTLGVLEDVYGNEVWDEEFPVISSLFAERENQKEYTTDQILPFLHVSRYFHIDYNGLSFGALEPVRDINVKVVDKNGSEHLDADGNKRYRVYLIKPRGVEVSSTSRQSAYRVHVFVDMIPEIDELYLTYNKVEVSISNGIRNQELSYRERLNPRAYYRYLPEESEVIDLPNEREFVYSSKPASLKNQVLGLPQPSTYGWKYFVPKKAIPDPRIFQLFRWRLACEFTEPVISTNEYTSHAPDTIFIRVGIVIPPNGSHSNSRANFLFYQLNESDYNFSKIKFVNPLQGGGFDYSFESQKSASYWAVDLTQISHDDLGKFDILVWAPNGNASVGIPSEFLSKVNYFTENAGGTFIVETSGFSDLDGLFNDIGFSAPLFSRFDVTGASVLMDTTRVFDPTPATPNDDFNSFGMWQEWPPNVANILNTYNDIGSILTSADVLAGWDLTDDEMDELTPYASLSGVKSQYIASFPSAQFSVVAEAKDAVSNDYYPVLLHKKYNSGGNLFISTASFFEDHLFRPNGEMASKTLTISSLDDLLIADLNAFRQMISAEVVASEMKFRLNAMLFATTNKPSPQPGNTPDSFTSNPTTNSTTIYCDWKSDWVIDPSDGVLNDKEKTEGNFALLPTRPDDVNPVWQKILSDKSIKQMILEKLNTLNLVDKNMLIARFEGGNRRYFIVTTNPLVQVLTSDLLTDSSLPTAWTKAYSPALQIPSHFGPYVVRDEMIQGIGAGNGRRVYPPKPYKLRPAISYVTSSSSQGKITAQITINGTLSKVVKIPATTQTTQVWVPGTEDRLADVILYARSDGFAFAEENIYKHMGLFPKPRGMDTWTDANYTALKSTNWPFFGLKGLLIQGGYVNPSADYVNITSATVGKVILVQKFLNQMIFFQVITGPALAEDGVYGSITAGKVREYQQVRGAQYVDGIVDAETWSLIGYGFGQLYLIPGWAEAMDDEFERFAHYAHALLDLGHVSDGSSDLVYTKQSWYSGSPSVIREGFWFMLREHMDIYKVSIMPYLEGASNKLIVDWLDLTPGAVLSGAYSYAQGSPGVISNASGGNGVWIDITVPEKNTNTILFRVTQDGAAGWGDSRFIGIRDVAVHAKKLVAGVPGYYRNDTTTIPGSTYTTTVPFTYSASVEFDTGVPKTFYPTMGLSEFTANGATITNVRWDAATLKIMPAELDGLFDIEVVEVDVNNDPNVLGQSRNYIKLTFQGYDFSLSDENFKFGQMIGNGSFQYYTCNTSGVVDPYPRSYGWITKEDGLKLICDVNGKPFGFPAAFPTGAESSMHFMRYKLHGFDVDQTLYFGFYDTVRKEFITNAYGEPDITYYDYIRRGPQNVFIAVQTTYELDTTSNLPGSTDPIDRPFKWVMPVYGVTTRLKSKIQLESLSPNLGNDQSWAISIKTGSFAKTIQLRPRSEGSLTNYLKNYQGTNIVAYYDIPEAKNSPWSSKHGRPNIDVKGEIPMIIDDGTIQIRQYPILTVQVPTATPSLADPWLPEFTMYRRETLTSDWREVPLADIADYDVWNGIIELKTPLTNNDPRLIKVDYTSERKVLDIRHDGTQRINLNPYTNEKPDWLNKPLYVYILPEYVMDKDGNRISDSLQTRTVRMTESISIFNPYQADFDPTAILIGIIYISNSFDINDLTILDTRQRGGGFKPEMEETEIEKIEPEAASYWDFKPLKAVSYQKGGYIILRLPEELREDFTDSDIIAIIERNITAGVRFHIENEDGDRWIS